jgi:hypothetical protein
VLDYDPESRRQFSRERAAQLAEDYRRAQGLRHRDQQLAEGRKLTRTPAFRE